ncbi:hypothetical protein [Actinomadura madurae]|uniref:hypothetical protein n=1 Tax=Actinomadura madurae TaxID=1993 RepID=UPI0020D2352D|nr:hypothetical protein [Actinomadura madurae]MCP9979041.1 hypothetical protein [Actinomadura madurae]MCQ0009431.1 hypothetical protein [Actinomadura madurae]
METTVAVPPLAVETDAAPGASDPPPPDPPPPGAGSSGARSSGAVPSGVAGRGAPEIRPGGTAPVRVPTTSRAVHTTSPVTRPPSRKVTGAEPGSPRPCFSLSSRAVTP